MRVWHDDPLPAGNAQPIAGRSYGVVPDRQISLANLSSTAKDTKHGRVLIIHENQRIARYLDGVLRNGLSVRTFPAWNDSPAILWESQPDVILCDAKSLSEDAECLLSIRKNETADHDIPLILLLDYQYQNLSQTRKLLSIATDYVSSSTEPSLLKWKVMKVISQKRELEDLRSRESESRKRAKRFESLTLMMAHDLKSSVIAMNGFFMRLKVGLEKKSVDGHMKWILDRILSASQFMEEFLSDMNELLSSELLSTKRTPIRLDEIATEVIAQHRALQTEKNVCIELHAQEDLPEAMGNRSRIKQVFDNLLSNALCHMGNVQNPTVSISIVGNGNMVETTVSDNGVGIPTDYRERVFDPFTRGPNAARQKGSGLGLSIVKQIINRHHGKIWLESEAGKGTRFIFALPLSSTKV